jgi:hypothetical protein
MFNRISSCELPKEIQAKLHIFFEDLKNIGISYLGHGVVNNKGNHTGYFSNNDWGKSYISNRYFFNEPILQNFEQNHANLILWSGVKDSNSIAQIRNQFINLVSGMTICKEEAGYHTFFNIGFTTDVNLADFCFYKRDLLLAYFNIFNNYHLSWRKEKEC